MADVVIIANGEFPRKEYPHWLIANADFIICCDGAAERFLRHSAKHLSGRLPDVVIGDLDSLGKRTRGTLGERVVHVSEQERNDLTKALRYVLDHWCSDQENYIHILGIGGRREDHTIGNYALMMEHEKEFHLSERGIHVEAVSDWTTAFAICESTTFECGAGRSVSIFTPDNSLNIKSKGLEWPTDHVVFDNWWQATLNRSTADRVTLTLSHKSMVLVVLY